MIAKQVPAKNATSNLPIVVTTAPAAPAVPAVPAAPAAPAVPAPVIAVSVATQKVEQPGGKLGKFMMM